MNCPYCGKQLYIGKSDIDTAEEIHIYCRNDKCCEYEAGYHIVDGEFWHIDGEKPFKTLYDDGEFI